MKSLSLLTFGAKKPQHLDTYVVNFNVIVRDMVYNFLYNPMCFNRLLVLFGEVLCIKLMLSFLQAIAPERLTDDIPVQCNSVANDILVGSDYFSYIIDGDRITLPSGYLLLSSKLGYVLTGSG